jgi:hypothetical protein
MDANQLLGFSGVFKGLKKGTGDVRPCPFVSWSCAPRLAINAAHVFRRIRQKCEMTGTFDCQREFALMPCARANFAARANFRAVGQVAAQLVGVFIVNGFVFVFAVNADPAHGWTETALLSVASAIPSAATAIIAWTARSARAASWIIHSFRELLLNFA